MRLLPTLALLLVGCVVSPRAWADHLEIRRTAHVYAESDRHSHRVATLAVDDKAQIIGDAQENGYYYVRTLRGDEGWVYRSLVRRLPGDLEIRGATEDPRVVRTPPPTHYRVGTWNLEHFKPGASRGFPENTRGGPTYPARGPDEYEFIASVIRDIDFKLVLLQEIGWKNGTSPELDNLLEFLGESWAYGIGESGDAQHVAILYDTEFVAIARFCETSFENKKVQSSGVFDRQGFYAHATFAREGEPMNDFVAFGVHLASGQDKNKNHDEAMRAYRQELTTQVGPDGCIPEGETDILIGGDFNASRFDKAGEQFWTEMESSGWNVLADTPESYGPTRLSSVPLQRKDSVIDYLIVSASETGLFGNEITSEPATIHTEFLDGRSAEDFRKLASDHLPVSVEIAVVEDDD